MRSLKATFVLPGLVVVLAGCGGTVGQGTMPAS